MFVLEKPLIDADPVSPEVAVRITVLFVLLFFFNAFSIKRGSIVKATSLKANVGPLYKDRNEIRGKQLYDLIDTNEISNKFEQIVGKNYCGLNEEEKDYDSRDVIGEPNTDI